MPMDSAKPMIIPKGSHVASKGRRFRGIVELSVLSALSDVIELPPDDGLHAVGTSDDEALGRRTCDELTSGEGTVREQCRNVHHVGSESVRAGSALCSPSTVGRPADDAQAVNRTEGRTEEGLLHTASHALRTPSCVDGLSGASTVHAQPSLRTEREQLEVDHAVKGETAGPIVLPEP